MKAYRGVALCLVLFTFLLSGVCIPNAEAGWPSGIRGGIRCWEIKNGDTVLAILKVGITRTVGVYYLLTGEMFVGGVTQNIFIGTAKVDADKILISGLESGKDNSSMHVGIGHTILDKNTLNGTAESIGHDHNNYDTPFDSGGGIYIDSDTQYSKYSVNYVPCP